jgi:DNA-binding NarL/FixJ family response regulator
VSSIRGANGELAHAERRPLAAAVDLYRRLVREGPLPFTETDVGTRAPGSAALAELLALGLARRSGQRVVPVPVSPAIERLLAAQLREMAVRHQALRQAYRDLMRLQADRATAGGDPAAWRILDRAEAASLSVEMGRTARTELLDVWSAPAGEEPPGRASDGVPHRVVCDHRLLETARGERSLRQLRRHAEVRVATGVTACLRLADATHMLVATAPTASTYFRSPAIAGAVRRLFEVLWAGAATVNSTTPKQRPAELTAAQWRILQLMPTGLDDAGLAGATGTTVRTVRAHVAAVLAALGARTRFAAGVEAARRGWL